MLLDSAKLSDDTKNAYAFRDLNSKLKLVGKKAKENDMLFLCDSFECDV